MTARVAVLQFPGVNCETESVRALAAHGLEAEIVPWNEPVSTLDRFDAFLLPGGFSFQDRVRAGAVAARHRFLDALRRRDERGTPILGVCNGAQVLVEAGLVPGGVDSAAERPGSGAAHSGLGMALAPNRMPARGGYLARWVHCRIERTDTAFTNRFAAGERLPLPMAHGEGRFTTRSEAEWARIEAARAVAVRYVSPEPGPAAKANVHAAPEGATPYPWNPNGSRGAAAAVGNARGSVLAIMPHPERAQHLLHVPLDWPDEWGDRRRAVRGGSGEEWSAGPGAKFFASLAHALGAAQPASAAAQARG
jgi:phosphoribosylformylglycinamidine synthase